MKKIAALLAGIALMMMTSSAMATAAGFLEDGKDAYWRGNLSATIVAESAGYEWENSFGIYDALDPYNKVELFGGAATAGDEMSIAFGSFSDGVTTGNLLITGSAYAFDRIASISSTTFGFYLLNHEGIFYSDTALNNDGFDHMAFYGLGQEYQVNLEDLYGGGDRDYNDMIISLASITPASEIPEVPEPGTLVLIGAGFMGLAVLRKRRA